MRCLIFALFSSALSGCLHPPLRVRKELITPCSHPSYQLKTPREGKKCSYRGEQLIAHWNLPKGQWQNAILIVQWRLADASVQKFQVALESKKSSWQHSLLGRDFYKSGGIASYRVRILRNASLIAEVAHPMWIEPVPIFVNSTGSKPCHLN